MKRFAVLSIAALSLTACGDSDSVAATATEGDAFCRLAEIAADDNNALENVDVSDPAQIKLQLGAAIDSLSAAAAKAPKDIAETVNELLAREEQLEKLLKDNDYDVEKMSQTDEGKKFGDEASESKLGEEFDAYLSDKCGIAPSDDPSTDTTPADTTPADTVAADDTSVDTIVDLGEGEEAINAFLDYYELGTDTTLTDDERSCIVNNLIDKVTGSELNQAVAGQSSPEVEQALGLAFIDCGVAVGS